VTKVVINQCYGGFGISPEATLELYRRKPSLIAATPAKATEYLDQARLNEYKQTWLDYLAGTGRKGMFLTVFTPDLGHMLYAREIPRDCPELIALLEDPEWGTEKVSDSLANLHIVEVPDDAKWEIAEYDGYEHVAEQHRTWR
jgi:hypothetical protein